MAIDTTHTLQLGPTPVEVVATLGLTPGEYRIENSHPDGGIRSDARIFFVATADLIMGTPSAGHALAPGAREDIGIERGQRWYFWAPGGGTLVITESEAGGAIGGSPPRIVLPHFYITVYQTSAARPMSPSGGSYERLTSIVTPPTGWSNERTDPAAGTLEMEYSVRALIDPNTEDLHITPIWGAVHLLGEGGTITGVTAVQPLQGGGLHGHVEVRLPARSLETDRYADDSVTLAKLAPGAAGDVIGYDAQGDPASITPAARIEQLDVPPYAGEPDGQLLALESEAPVWVDPPVIPRLVEFYYGTAVPTPAALDDVWFVTDRATGRSGVVDADGTTPRTTILRGDIYEWVPTAGHAGTGAWVYRANLDSAYGLVTAMTEGLMSAADFVKLTGIESGAEVNVRADWDEADPTNDAFVENKPHIPLDQVPADWDEDTSVARILNKPERIDQFDAPAPTAMNNGRVLGVVGGQWALVESGAHRIDLGTNLPDMPASGNLYIFEGAVTGLTGVVESDMMTARTSVQRGDTVRYDGSRWVYLGTVNTEYPLASSTTAGLMSMADFVKLLGIAPGAEANVNADWNANSGAAQILNRPTIPPAPVQSDWNARTGLARILNKPDIPDDPVQSDWNVTDTAAQAFIRNKPGISGLPRAPAAGSAVAVYELSVATDGTATWATAYVPGVPTVSVGGTLPASPSDGDLHFMSTVVNNAPMNVRQADGTTARPTLLKGDAYLYDETNEVWVYQGDVHTVYEEATAAAPGLLSAALFTKLSGIAAGAEVNVKADWSETDSDSDSFIDNKPTIPAAQVQADWNETDTDAVSYIDNKPTIPAAQVNADWNATTGVAEVLNKPTIPAAQVQADWSQSDAAIISFIRNRPEILVDIGGLDLSGQAGMVLGLSEAGAWTFHDLSAGHGDVVDFGESFPESPRDEQVFIFTGGANNLTGYQDSGGDALTSASRGDVAAYDMSLTAWVAKGTVNTIYAAATDAVAGLMPPELVRKLSRIADGAEVNVKADWNETDSDSDSFIDNKPTIPRLVQSDWDEGGPGDPAFIRNKPTIPALTQASLYAAVKSILVHAGSSGVTADDTNNEIDIEGGVAGASGTRLTAGTDFHPNPNNNDLTIFVGSATDLEDYETDVDGTPITTATRGDIARYDSSEAAWVSEGTVNTTYDAATQNADGLMTAAAFSKLAGIAENAEVNVQPDWTETDADSDAFVRNKPTIPAAFVPSQSNLYAAVKAIVAGAGSTNVETDDTNNVVRILGTRTRAGPNLPNVGTAHNNDAFIFTEDATGLTAYRTPRNVALTTASKGDFALYRASASAWIFYGNLNTVYETATASVAGLMGTADRTKLDGIAAGAEVNVQPDWNETDTGADAFVRNKPTIPAEFSPSQSNLYAAVKAILVHTSSTATADDTDNEIDFAGEANVQPDWSETDTDSDAFVRNKPTIPPAFSPSQSNLYAAVKAILVHAGSTGAAADDANNEIDITGGGGTGFTPTQANLYAAVKAILVHAGSTGAAADDANNEIDITGGASFSPSQSNLYAAVKAILVHASSTATADDTNNEIDFAGEANVQPDWNETDTGADSFVRNKPTIPPAFSPSQSNLYAAVKAILVHAGSTGAAADDANNEIDITGGGGGGSSFLPTPSEKDVGDSALYHGWSDVGGGWLIRRLTYSTDATTTARQSGNTAITSLADAWMQRATLSYAA